MDENHGVGIRDLCSDKCLVICERKYGSWRKAWNGTDTERGTNQCNGNDRLTVVGPLMIDFQSGSCSWGFVGATPDCGCMAQDCVCVHACVYAYVYKVCSLYHLWYQLSLNLLI